MNRHLSPKQIDALLLETATAADRHEWEDHLIECASCRSALDAQKSLLAEVRSATDAPAPPGELNGRIEAALRRNRTRTRGRANGSPFDKAWLGGWAWTAAAIVLAFAAGVWVGRSPVGESKSAEAPLSLSPLSTPSTLATPAHLPSDHRLPPPASSRQAVYRSTPTPQFMMTTEDTSTQRTLHAVRSAAPQLQDNDAGTQPTLGKDDNPYS